MSAQRQEKNNVPVELKVKEKGLFWLSLAAWLALFAAGLLVATLPYRMRISFLATAAEVQSGVQPADSLIESWFVVLTCYTPINIALLALLAGVLGALGCRAHLYRREAVRIEREQEAEQQPPGRSGASPKRDSDATVQQPWFDRVNPYLSGVIRGFFVYLLLISGLLILTEDPFADLSPQRYIRLAGFLSLLSFVVSFRPEVFGALFERAARRAARTGEDTRADSDVER